MITMKRIVIKIGSSSLFNGQEFATKEITALAKEIKKIRDKGTEVCLITSGAIAVGMSEMGLDRKPAGISSKQALAAIGQAYLMERYEKIFQTVDIKPAQILLSHDDFGNRDRVKNLNNTISSLFKFGALPIINENDALATEEIKVGDNDTLASMIALNIGAELLVIISDVDGLYDKNPVNNTDAKLIKTVDKIDKNILSLAKAPSSKVGTGGMITKIKAAKICCNSGIKMMIVGNGKISSLSEIINGKNLGTEFIEKGKMPVRSNWILSCANVSGKILVDNGAKEALIKRNSLLSCGIIDVKGTFSSGSVVEIANENGESFAKGIVAFGSDNLKTLDRKGEHRSQVIIHANNLVSL